MAALSPAPLRVAVMMNCATNRLARLPSVLIATDDPVARDVLAQCLEAAGNQVRCAGSPEGVLMKMHLEMPDLVVLHPGPRFSGPILYQRLRTHPNSRGVPVLLVARPAELERFVTKPEPALFASKPVRLDLLASRVQRLMQIVPPAAKGNLGWGFPATMRSLS
jgi:DNA-binding response OmpR family regulator